MKKHVHCRFEEDLLDRVDRAALLLGLNRTELIKLACKSYLRFISGNHPRNESVNE